MVTSSSTSTKDRELDERLLSLLAQSCICSLISLAIVVVMDVMKVDQMKRETRLVT
jgi:hypothetical protein